MKSLRPECYRVEGSPGPRLFHKEGEMISFLQPCEDRPSHSHLLYLLYGCGRTGPELSLKNVVVRSQLVPSSVFANLLGGISEPCCINSCDSFLRASIKKLFCSCFTHGLRLRLTHGLRLNALMAFASCYCGRGLLCA